MFMSFECMNIVTDLITEKLVTYYLRGAYILPELMNNSLD